MKRLQEQSKSRGAISVGVEAQDARAQLRKRQNIKGARAQTSGGNNSSSRKPGDRRFRQRIRMCTLNSKRSFAPTRRGSYQKVAPPRQNLQTRISG